MKLSLKKMLLLSAAAAVLQSVPALAAGWVTNSNGFQVYQNDDGSTVTNSWIKATENGNTIWYYATNDGTLRTDGWQKVNGSWYYFDGNGVMQTGWVDNDMYYCDDNTGAMRTGWKELRAPEDYYLDDSSRSNGETFWFYFNTSSGEKFYSSDGNVKVKSINGINYGFDEYGIMQTGWAVAESGGSDLTDYLYFAEKTDNNFSLGQRLSNTWYATVGPEDDSNEDLSTGSVEWFYFKSNGKPVASTDSTKGVIQKVSGKRYLFDDKGNPMYGVQQDTDGNYYYCGTSKTDCSVRTGKMTITDGDNEKFTAYFDSTGKGVTGVKDSYLYYNGRLQKADSDVRYQKAYVAGNWYVINSSGAVQKNRKNTKDKDGNTFSTNSSGILTTDGGITELEEYLSPAILELD